MESGAEQIAQNQNLTALLAALRLSADMKIRALLITLFALSPLTSGLHAATLGEMTRSAGFEWIIGKWATEDGNLALSYTWKLDEHAVAVTFKMGDRVSEGLIMVKPGTDKVVSGGADNKGGMFVATWTTLNGNPTVMSTHTDADGTDRKMAAEYIKVNNDTLTVKVYNVGADDQPDASAAHEVTFKRQP
jgi:hypothetical protein